MKLESNLPTLIVVRGIPGSGKSYLAQALQKALGVDNVVMLDPDTTDYESEEYLKHSAELSRERVDEKLHAYRFLRGKAYAAIEERKIIIWNQPFTDLEIFKKMIDRLETHAREFKTNLALLIVEVDIDEVMAKKRVLERKLAGGHGPSDKTLQKRISDYQSFSGGDFTTVAVHGEDNPEKSVNSISVALRQLWDNYK